MEKQMIDWTDMSYDVIGMIKGYLTIDNDTMKVRYDNVLSQFKRNIQKTLEVTYSINFFRFYRTRFMNKQCAYRKILFYELHNNNHYENKIYERVRIEQNKQSSIRTSKFFRCMRELERDSDDEFVKF